MIEIPTFKFALIEGLSDEYLPKRGSERATGWDVRSTTELTIRLGEYVKIPLGFRVFAPPGWWLELRPRSSTFAKKNLHALYGVIDEDYEGEMVFACQYLPIFDLNTPFISSHLNIKIQAGEAIGQLIPVRRQEMVVERVTNEEYQALCKERNTARGAGGFGSTG